MWEEVVNISKLEGCIVFLIFSVVQIDFGSSFLYGVTCKIYDLHD